MNLWRSFARTSLLRPTHTVSSLSWKVGVRWLSTPRNATVSTITEPLKRMLDDDRHGAALNFFQDAMKNTSLDSSSRFKAFVQGITIFMLRGHVAEAFSVYTRLEAEGYIPPKRIQGTMSVLRTIHRSDAATADLLVQAATKAFSIDEFNEEDFRFMLRIISSSTRLPAAVYDDLVDAFLASRSETEYKLSDKTKVYLSYIRTRSGFGGRIHRYRSTPEDEAALAGDEKRLAEFASLVKMGAKDPDLSPLIHFMLHRMQRTGVSPDRIFYNRILSVLANRRRYADLFNLYSTMMRGDTDMLPDAYTFGTLLPILKTFAAPRTMRTRKVKKPEGAPSPRQLYRDMTFCHNALSAGHDDVEPIVATGSVLNKFLDLFVSTGDYAAAYVVLRSYQVFSLPVTITTYQTVLEGLVKRMEHEFLSQSLQELSKFWSHRFTGSIKGDADALERMGAILDSGAQHGHALDPLPAKTPDDQQPLPDEELVKEIETDGDVLGLTYRKIARDRPGRPAYTVPAPLAVTGLLPTNKDQYDLTPLLRIIRRAILADRPRLFMTGAKVVTIAIRHAKAEMIPARGTKTVSTPVPAEDAQPSEPDPSSAPA